MTARVRGMVLDTTNNESQIFLQNPERFEETYAAIYEERAALSAPHHRRQFKATELVPITMELIYNRKILSMAARKAGNKNFTLNDLDRAMLRAKAFFASLASPVRHPGTVLLQSPPTVLLIWPHVMRLRAKMDRARISNQEFSIDGHLTEFVADLEFKEIRERDYYSVDIRKLGSMRGGTSG